MVLESTAPLLKHFTFPNVHTPKRKKSFVIVASPTKNNNAIILLFLFVCSFTCSKIVEGGYEGGKGVEREEMQEKAALKKEEERKTVENR